MSYVAKKRKAAGGTSEWVWKLRLALLGIEADERDTAAANCEIEKNEVLGHNGPGFHSAGIEDITAVSFEVRVYFAVSKVSLPERKVDDILKFSAVYKSTLRTFVIVVNMEHDCY
ncbi:hypothetical protein GWI33_019347 [Rhynchophorus ferrugineus]|uniref:Uncharacterized protein n=1 Tax=Rhynchophorus ferrugineus TaxID=354439 RepID=A0A834HW98_RHYFE|nr:hypothetical protein GWI33_019347 [Rhynchophorus ferrugineus]